MAGKARSMTKGWGGFPIQGIRPSLLPFMEVGDVSRRQLKMRRMEYPDMNVDTTLHG